MIRTLRPIILAILSGVSALGFVDPGLSDAIAANSEAILTGAFALWSVLSYKRNREDAGQPLIGSARP